MAVENNQRLCQRLAVDRSQWANGCGGLQSRHPIWRPPKQADKVRPGLVFYSRHTVTQAYTQIDMGRRNRMPKIAIYNVLLLSHGHCVFSAESGGLVFKTTLEAGDSAYEVEDSLGGGALCTWHRNLVIKRIQLLFALLNRGVS